jgi:hypothetical protein
MHGATATRVSPYKACRVNAQSPEALPKQAAKRCCPSWSGALKETVKVSFADVCVPLNGTTGL